MEVDRMNIYVGNLSYEVSEDDVRKAFEDFGSVDSVKIITDKRITPLGTDYYDSGLWR